MRLKLAACMVVLCNFVFVQHGNAAWTIQSPTDQSSFPSTANISGGGMADLQGVSYIARIVNTKAETLNTSSGSSTGPQGMPQMATWSCTVPVPSQGYWPVSYSSTPLQGTAAYRIEPVVGTAVQSGWFAIIKNH